MRGNEAKHMPRWMLCPEAGRRSSANARTTRNSFGSLIKHTAAERGDAAPGPRPQQLGRCRRRRQRQRRRRQRPPLPTPAGAQQQRWPAAPGIPGRWDAPAERPGKPAEPGAARAVPLPARHQALPPPRGGAPAGSQLVCTTVLSHPQAARVFANLTNSGIGSSTGAWLLRAAGWSRYEAPWRTRVHSPSNCCSPFPTRFPAPCFPAPCTCSCRLQLRCPWPCGRWAWGWRWAPCWCRCGGGSALPGTRR